MTPLAQMRERASGIALGAPLPESVFRLGDFAWHMGLCLSCGEELAEGREFRCARCLWAVKRRQRPR
jgi:hypothetical protein